MLVYGTCNPAGEGEDHAGVYLKKTDIARLVETKALLQLPVKIEHVGDPVGRIVDAWQHADRLDCVFRIDNNSKASVFAQEFVKDQRCPELSLSYQVTMQHSSDGKLSGEGKELIEVSIVRKGARHDCKIRGYQRR